MSGPAFILPPYAQGLGIVVDHVEGETPILSVPFSARMEGRPGFIHGGALSGLMEMAAMMALRYELGDTARLKPVNIQVEFMRGGKAQVTYARGSVTRAGRRVALVNAEAWQDDPAKPIALAQLKILIAQPELQP